MAMPNNRLSIFNVILIVLIGAVCLFVLCILLSKRDTRIFYEYIYLKIEHFWLSLQIVWLKGKLAYKDLHLKHMIWRKNRLLSRVKRISIQETKENDKHGENS